MAPNNVDADKLIHELEALVADPGSVKEAGRRAHIRSLLNGASATLEDPFEMMQRIVYSPLPLVTARIAQQHKIFDTLVKSSEPVDLAVLAAETKLDPRILESVMDYLCTQNMAEEVTRGKYSRTKTSQLLISPLLQDAVTHFHDNCLPAFGALNTVLGRPNDSLLAFKVGQHTDDIFYEWMKTRPVQQGAFHRFMQAQFADLPTWLDAVDFAEEMGKDLDDEQVAFVDVGGGNGQQCEALVNKYPDLRGRVVLQDRPDVLEQAPCVARIEKQSHDFFTEQPVKGARVYYFRQIMHNYADEACIKILQSHVPAMGPNSVIVLDDKTLPDDKPSPETTLGVEYTAGLSLAMKAMFDAQERRETHWRQLLARAGLRARDIRKFTKFDDSVIIAVSQDKS